MKRAGGCTPSLSSCRSTRKLAEHDRIKAGVLRKPEPAVPAVRRGGEPYLPVDYEAPKDVERRYLRPSGDRSTSRQSCHGVVRVRSRRSTTSSSSIRDTAHDWPSPGDQRGGRLEWSSRHDARTEYLRMTRARSRRHRFPAGGHVSWFPALSCTGRREPSPETKTSSRSISTAPPVVLMGGPGGESS